MDQNFEFSPELTLEQLRKKIRTFVEERDWDQYHSPRNLLLAFVGEVGELSELFQWRGEVETGLPTFTEHERERVGEELSDCLIYLLQLADKCRIDLPKAIERKMVLNAEKYSVQIAKGSSNYSILFDESIQITYVILKNLSRKYTELGTANHAQDQDQSEQKQ